MRKVIVSLLLTLFLFAGRSEAQDTLSIAAGGQIFNLQSSAYYSDSATFYIYIKNVSTTSYSGTVSLQTRVDSSMTSSFVTVQIDSTTVFLNPNDSFPVAVFEIFTPSNYRVGGNIVVIWPAATNAFFSNTSSAADTVYILGNMSIGDISGTGFSVYPVPFKSSLHIVMDTGEEVPEKIRLKDITGRMIVEIPYDQVVEFPEEIPTGTYFVELTFNQSTSKMIRVIKGK